MAPTRRKAWRASPATAPRWPTWKRKLFAAAESRIDADLQKSYHALFDDTEAARKALRLLPWLPWSESLEARQHRLTAWDRAIDPLNIVAWRLAYDQRRDQASRLKAFAAAHRLRAAYHQIDQGKWASADHIIVRCEARLRGILSAPTQRGRGPGAWYSVVKDLVAQYPKDTPAEIVDRLGKLATPRHAVIKRYVRRQRPPECDLRPCPKDYHFHFTSLRSDDDDFDPMTDDFAAVTRDRVKKAIRTLRRKSASR